MVHLFREDIHLGFRALRVFDLRRLLVVFLLQRINRRQQRLLLTLVFLELARDDAAAVVSGLAGTYDATTGIDCRLRPGNVGPEVHRIGVSKIATPGKAVLLRQRRRECRRYVSRRADPVEAGVDVDRGSTSVHAGLAGARHGGAWTVAGDVAGVDQVTTVLQFINQPLEGRSQVLPHGELRATGSADRDHAIVGRGRSAAGAAGPAGRIACDKPTR